MRTVRPVPISEAAMAPFGWLVQRPVATGRWPLSPRLEIVDPAAALRIDLVRIAPANLPVEKPAFERHRRTEQLFLPLDVARYLCVVARGLDAPDLETLRAFVVPGDTGIAYGVDIWHLPMEVLDAPASFAVMMGMRGDKALDEEWHQLREPLVLEPPTA